MPRIGRCLRGATAEPSACSHPSQPPRTECPDRRPRRSRTVGTSHARAGPVSTSASLPLSAGSWWSSPPSPVRAFYIDAVDSAELPVVEILVAPVLGRPVHETLVTTGFPGVHHCLGVGGIKIKLCGAPAQVISPRRPRTLQPGDRKASSPRDDRLPEGRSGQRSPAAGLGRGRLSGLARECLSVAG